MIHWIESRNTKENWLMDLAKKFGLAEGESRRNAHMWFSDNRLKVFYSEDNTPKWGWLKHLSISHPKRYPYWEEILEAKERFMGDVDVAMILPKKEDYINFHKNCFHLWQIPGGWGLR